MKSLKTGPTTVKRAYMPNLARPLLHLRVTKQRCMFLAGNNRILLLVASLMTCLCCFSQVDSSKKRSIDSIILRQKGIIGQLAQNLLVDTAVIDVQGLLRTDQPFQPYKGHIIRNIEIETHEFDIIDSSKRLDNSLKRLSDQLHRKTRDFVIRNHLFFSRDQKLSPYVMGDNERHLRDLPFVRDASIRVTPVAGTDSVDIVVVTNDVLSIGGSFRMHNTETVSASIKEDNFMGYGDQVSVQGLFDAARAENFGYGFDFTKRNIMGSFINASAGFTNFAKTINLAEREERVSYFRLTRPLVNRFMKWTYGGEVELHQTQNFYSPDSVYLQDYQYKYDLIDAWGSWNMDADKPDGNGYGTSPRLRRLLGLRLLQQKFDYRPLKFEQEYDYRYADLQAVLGAFSFFKQNFYKTQFIYGFGRNEDVPEGMEASFTTGWTKKQQRERPFAGLNFQHYFFTRSGQYFDYSIKAGAYLYNKKLEDIDLLARLDYFSHLHHMNSKWKQRYFLGASITKQVNSVLGEPVRIESQYGLEELRNNNASGNFRATVKAESVFFSPWTVLFFKFAPFVFTNATYINLKINQESVPKLYASIGGGVRVRNESLIFGTTEFRGMYFPRKNFRNESWRIEVNTNIRFKYNSNFIRRPEFVGVN